MGVMASQITGLAIVYSTVYSSVYQGKHQSSTSLAFVRGIHREPVNSRHKWPVTRKMFPFDDVIIVFDVPWNVLNWVVQSTALWGLTIDYHFLEFVFSFPNNGQQPWTRIQFPHNQLNIIFSVVC